MPVARSPVMTVLTNLVVAAAAGLALYVAVLGLLWFRQESLLFAPTVLPAKHVLATAADIHEVSIPVDGAQLSALHLRLPKPRGVVFFLHGNAGSLQSWFTNTAERTKLYEQAQVIFKEQAPWFTIAHAVQLKPVRKEVIDFKLSPFGRHSFYGVDIKE